MIKCPSCHNKNTFIFAIPKNDGEFVHLNYKCSICEMEWIIEREINKDIRIKMRELTEEEGNGYFSNSNMGNNKLGSSDSNISSGDRGGFDYR